MTQLDSIARADEIVGLTKLSDWPKAIANGWADDIRWSRYQLWLHRNGFDTDGIGADMSFGQLAERVISAHAAKHPQPSDGLPPGPWLKHGGFSPAHTTFVPRGCVSSGTREICTTETEALAKFIARCGSPAVRSILAACDDAELERWAKVIGKYQISSACDAVVSEELVARGIGALPTGHVTLFCGARR